VTSLSKVDGDLNKRLIFHPRMYLESHRSVSCRIMATPTENRGSTLHSTDPVNRIMSAEVLTVDVKDPAGEVLRIFTDYPVHHLPVLDGNTVVGMLSTADLMKLDLFLPKGGNSPIEYLNQRLKVGALVRRPLVSIEGHHSIESAAQLMAHHGVHALPVVDSRDQLLGIVTTTDIIYAALRPKAAVDPNSSAPVVSESQLITMSAAELAHAHRAAEAVAGTAKDADLVCKAVVFLSAKVAQLDQVRLAAERYVNAGQDEHLHGTLIRTLDAARRAEQRGYETSPPRR
jgi:CBS domain-containing membrane protein